MNITELLNRRSDLSTFLVHLTREFKGTSARDNLNNILKLRTIEARTMYGPLKNRLEPAGKNLDSQKCVCFTETPLEYTYLLVARIENRQFEFGPYAVAITKRVARKRGINPIWYLDITPGHPWLAQNVDRLADRFLANNSSDFDVEGLFPFIDHMGTGENYKKEFWWEREWRYQGDFLLPDTVICLCPEDEIEYFAASLKAAGLAGSCIDPHWSLEKIIARLAGFDSSEIDVV
jgi:hypothetical protein